ncbi:hypothetical protein, partial [Gemmiger formicilis]|uniref:hypothetical protein n=1 Tax=Gemmiger formicilis TaxID=745368 RepID=UPI00195D039C
LGNFGIKIVPLIFRARMDCEMLGAGSGAQIVRVIALHTTGGTRAFMAWDALERQPYFRRQLVWLRLLMRTYW